MAKPYPVVISDEISHTATITRTVSSVPVGANLAYFRVVHIFDFPKRTPKNLRERYEEDIHCGFATPKAVFAFADNKATVIREKPKMFVAPPGFREAARTKGFMTAWEEFSKIMYEKKDHMEAFMASQIDLEDVVEFDVGTHMLFDQDGQVLPTAILFDYMNGFLRNGNYDMTKALKILSKDKRVMSNPDTTSRRARTSKEEPVLSIFDVPHYNRSPASSQFLSFWFAPTVEDMRAIWEKAKSYGTKYPSTTFHQAIFDLDLMGLRAGGAAKYPDYYDHDNDEESSDED